MSYRDVSLLCFEGCVNAINSFIEKGTEHHTRIAARKRRGLIIIMIKINWKFSGLWNLKRGCCNAILLLSDDESQSQLSMNLNGKSFSQSTALNFEFLFIVYRAKFQKKVDFTPTFPTSFLTSSSF